MVNYISNIWNLQYENCSSYCPKSNQNMYTSKHLQWYYYMWYRISTSVKINWFKRLTWLYVPHFKKSMYTKTRSKNPWAQFVLGLRGVAYPNEFLMPSIILGTGHSNSFGTTPSHLDSKKENRGNQKRLRPLSRSINDRLLANVW